MASLTKRANGSYFVQFGHYQSRRTVGLGQVPVRAANKARSMIESLEQTKAMGSQPEPATAAWLDGIGDELADALAKAGLIPARHSMTVNQLIDQHLAERSDYKHWTRVNFAAARRLLLEKFDGWNIASVTSGDAEVWASGLRSRYAVASWSRVVKRARQLFAVAVRRGWLAENPFGAIKSPKQTNPGRLEFVPADVVFQLMAVADDRFAALLAFARFGGLRVPSEPAVLRWEQIGSTSFTVESPKTGRRTVPMFPELRDAVAPLRRPSGPVFPCVEFNSNVRTQLMRLVRHCGFKPWPRLWHNLRASRQTELTGQFPAHVVCRWLGNSPAVAHEHYLQVMDSDYDRAALRIAQRPQAISTDIDLHCSQDAMQDCDEAATNDQYLVPPAGAEHGQLSKQILELLLPCAAKCAASRKIVALLRRAG